MGFLNIGSETDFAKSRKNGFTLNNERFREGIHDGKGFSPLETIYMFMALLVRRFSVGNENGFQGRLIYVV